MSKREADASADGGGKRARGADNDGKVFQLFPKLKPDQRAKLQFDEEAFFSVTDQRSAERINK